MKQRDNISEKLKEEAPLLSKIEKQNSFFIPKNYFKEQLYVVNYKNLNNKIIHNYFDKLSYRFYITFSASLIALVLLISLVFTPKKTTITNEQLCELIIEDEYIDFDEELLYEAYSELNINTIESESDGILIDYLIDNNIETTTIIEEL